MSALGGAREALRGPCLVWLRNARVWRKGWKSSLVGSVGEPLFYFLGLGWGLASRA